MGFDEKEKLMFDHYKNIISNDEFDEYDILSILIFIRRHINNSKYPLIRDFSNLVAHRVRDQGKVMNAIKGAIENDYQLIPGSKRLKGYHGIYFNDWEAEWKTLGNEYDFKLTDEQILDITVCVFSLTQYTEYDDGSYRGRIELFQNNNYELALSTRENKDGSPYVNFAICGPLHFCKQYIAGHITQPVETVRVNRKLRLRDKTDFII